jgi:hypothetical protein
MWMLLFAYGRALVTRILRGGLGMSGMKIGSGIGRSCYQMARRIAAVIAPVLRPEGGGRLSPDP